MPVANSVSVEEVDARCFASDDCKRSCEILTSLDWRVNIVATRSGRGVMSSGISGNARRIPLSSLSCFLISAEMLKETFKAALAVASSEG